MSDVHLDVSPRATSSRCGDHDDDDDAQRVSSTVFTFDINVDDQSDYDVWTLRRTTNGGSTARRNAMALSAHDHAARS